jgi:hypothetical protein
MPLRARHVYAEACRVSPPLPFDIFIFACRHAVFAAAIIYRHYAPVHHA